MATLSKLIAGLLKLEREDNDTRTVLVLTPDEWEGPIYKVVKIREKPGKIIIDVEEKD